MKTISVAEARERRICRVCEQRTDSPMATYLGTADSSEHAHQCCIQLERRIAELERENAELRAERDGVESQLAGSRVDREDWQRLYTELRESLTWTTEPPTETCDVQYETVPGGSRFIGRLRHFTDGTEPHLRRDPAEAGAITWAPISECDGYRWCPIPKPFEPVEG